MMDGSNGPFVRLNSQFMAKGHFHIGATLQYVREKHFNHPFPPRSTASHLIITASRKGTKYDQK
jgi:hypothetical protein